MAKPNDPCEWLRRAKSNLVRAKDYDHYEIREIAIEDLFFDAQQCAEKAIKAVLVKKKINFPYTHDLAKLITLVRKSSIDMPDDLLEAAELTVYAVVTRYPCCRHPLSLEDLKWAIEIAEKIYIWAENVDR